MNFYPFHIGDYASSTRHLTWMEDCAYRRLIDCYYTREVPFPADKKGIYRLVVATTEEQREAVDTMLDEFFTLTESGYVHHRCDAEIRCANDKKEKASQCAQQRWRIARNTNAALPSCNERNANASENECERNANASLDLCEGNAPNPNPNPNPITQEETKKQKLSATPVGFAEFWSAYPKKVSKGDAEKAWRKVKASVDDVLAGIDRAKKLSRQWKDGYIPNPATWLNGRGWEDEYPSNVAELAPRMIGGMRVGKNWV